MKGNLRDAAFLRPSEAAELTGLSTRAIYRAMAYAGLRPGEALALTWAHVRERTLLIERAVSFGEIEGTNTGRRRTVPLVGPLAQDLAEWRLHAGRPVPEALVFPRHDGEPWTLTAYQNWRRRIYTPAATAAGVERPRPYDLRHSFVSLLIAEGHDVVEVARQAGHSPKMALDTYAHVFEEFARPSASTLLTASARRARSCVSAPSSRPSSTSHDGVDRARRGPPLRRRGHRAWTARADRALRRSAARPRDRPRCLALPLPNHRPAARAPVAWGVGAGGPAAARQAPFRAGCLDRFSPISRSEAA